MVEVCIATIPAVPNGCFAVGIFLLKNPSVSRRRAAKTAKHPFGTAGLRLPRARRVGTTETSTVLNTESIRARNAAVRQCLTHVAAVIPLHTLLWCRVAVRNKRHMETREEASTTNGTDRREHKCYPNFHTFPDARGPRRLQENHRPFASANCR